jgi:hypothetical protein
VAFDETCRASCEDRRPEDRETTSARNLRAGLVGLLRFAGSEEEQLLLAHGDDEDGSASHWAAAPTVEHNALFKDEQVARLRAVRHACTPPDTVEVDHRTARVYARCASVTLADVRAHQRRTTDELVAGLDGVGDDDLVDPARHSWLRGRQLWLQVVVRGFWHPLGHVGGVYLDRGEQARALGLHTHAVSTVEYLGLPAPALGMALYSLACTQARADEDEEALASLDLAIAANADLREHARRDPDLARLRSDGRLGPLLGVP